MTLHAFHPHRRDRTIEIGEPTYHRLMHELSLAGANEVASYGNGWSGVHPEHGQIVVSRVPRPARHRDHPAVAFLVECPDPGASEKVKASVERSDEGRDARVSGMRDPEAKLGQ